VKRESLMARLYSGKRLHVLAGAAVLVIALAMLLGGCVTISNVQLNGNVAAGSNQIISLTLTATTDAASPIRGVFAIRIPSAWDVKTVSFSGALNGAATESTVMETTYSTAWEATAPDAGHNGPKPGYKWWVGYSAASTWTSGQQSVVTIAIDTHARGGTYYLDSATGVADATDPEDTADSGLWQIGSTGSSPTGVLLDQVITLYCFTDVTPGIAYFEAIQGMGAMGLIQGYGPQAGGYFEFRPGNFVLRAQFAKMIVNALGLSVNEGMAPPVNFSDLGADVLPGPGVIDSLYPHEYVWVAYNNNIIKGYLDGTFKPFSPPIIRGHVVTMTVRALLNLHPGALQPVPDSFVQTWGNDLLPEHKANARVAEYNNLLAGLPLSTTAANGNAPMPRGEVAQVLWNMMGLIAGP